MHTLRFWAQRDRILALRGIYWIFMKVSINTLKYVVSNLQCTILILICNRDCRIALPSFPGYSLPIPVLYHSISENDVCT
jgi:hypothetical protein